MAQTRDSTSRERSRSNRRAPIGRRAPTAFGITWDENGARYVDRIRRGLPRNQNSFFGTLSLQGLHWFCFCTCQDSQVQRWVVARRYRTLYHHHCLVIVHSTLECRCTVPNYWNTALIIQDCDGLGRKHGVR